jgi:two-component system nitrogen regulation sensor histidine kinase GlnL
LSKKIKIACDIRPAFGGAIEAGPRLLRDTCDGRLDPASILDALPGPVLVVASDGRLAYVNSAAEQFFGASAATLMRRRLDELLSPDSPVFPLLRQVREHGHSVSEYGITIETSRIGSRFVSIELAPFAEVPGSAVVMLLERSAARKIDHQLSHRSAARSVTGMAALLAHEVKNPLSGIRGAAQLLEHGAGPGERELTRLICEEADRIVDLVHRMEMFADQPPIERGAVNIHEVLDRVCRIAGSGFAKGVSIVERYAPSLPPAFGHRDLLIQTFLNLVKNAAEAAPKRGGEIILATRYQQGIRVVAPGQAGRVDLPLMVSVQDNGRGIPQDLRAHLFDPFVTTKSGGKGLGLALVAKIVGDHGGVVQFDTEPRRTVFRVLLPRAGQRRG